MGDHASIVGDGLKLWAEQNKEKMNTAIKSAIAAKADEVLSIARELVPVSEAGQQGKYPHKPGNLREALYSKISAGGHFARVGIDVKKAYYAFMVHFGTDNFPGNPFLYKAKERVSGTIKDSINDNLAKGDET